MSRPAISVLLPARNAQSFLGEALESIREQTFEDFELVAVDDGSTDATAALLARAAAVDPRIRVVRGPGEGIARALNRGLAECRAPLVARMDGDDVALPRRLERQLAELERRPALAAVGSAVEIFPRESMTDGLRAYEAWLNSLSGPERIRRECLVESPLVHPAAMIRADALRAVGGWTVSGWPEDYALWLALLAAGAELDNLPEVLLRWRDHPERLTRTHGDYAMSAHVRLKASHLARGALGVGRCWMWGAGKTGRAFARALAAEGVRTELFVDVDPRKIGREMYGSPVVSPEALPAFGGVHLVVAVGARGARALIRDFLAPRGWVECVQFSCVG